MNKVREHPSDKTTPVLFSALKEGLIKELEKLSKNSCTLLDVLQAKVSVRKTLFDTNFIRFTKEEKPTLSPYPVLVTDSLRRAIKAYHGEPHTKHQ